ncbi:MAG: histidine ammonia-lyase [Candidatus Marinimicrobia bacterium]|nr:histidine ammonia-lyase [Candidatus Neomarinimicrobiota bacterium]
MSRFVVNNQEYSLADFKQFIKSAEQVHIEPQVLSLLADNRLALNELLAKSDRPVYGVNTGFGKLSNVVISPEDQLDLQINLLRSHAAGVGTPLDDDTVRLALLLKVISLSQGYSGVRPEVVALLAAMINKSLLPVVPSQGSVGASGDLAPLAHLCLPLIGEGAIRLAGEDLPAAEAFAKHGLEPLTLQPKEGLALINGTQVSTAIGVLGAIKLGNLVKAADIIGALSLDGLMGTPAPFTEEVHRLKRHAGQRDSAANLRTLTKGSAIRESHRQDDQRVQDIYSLRCMPQIHGSCRDAVEFVTNQLVNEANSVSDNPLVFAAEGRIISAGHFHGEVTAMACDLGAIAAAELASISERRIFALTAGNYGLPPFLVANPGLNSGFMMVQVTAAALVSENKTLTHPASVDSIPTGADQEDHVPMSPWAARKLLTVIANLENVLAIEYLLACQAIDFRDGLESGKGAMAAHRLLRAKVSRLEHDRVLHPDMAAAAELIASGALVEAVESVVQLR